MASGCAYGKISPKMIGVKKTTIIPFILAYQINYKT